MNHNRPLPDPPPDDRLGSWKAIAAYLKRDVSTVQRWERSEGMPIHRHHHSARGSVYAYRSELDAWWKSREQHLEPEGAIAPVAVDIDDASPLPAIKLGLRGRPGWKVAIVVAGSLAAIAGLGAWFATHDDDSWRDPLAEARVSPLTDFDGMEQAAAISRDGRFAAFVADRDGKPDVWVSQIGTGEFHNLTGGRAPEFINPGLRTLGFSADGALVTIWTTTQETPAHETEVDVQAVPTMGGELRPYMEGVAEFDWSSDGTRLVYHTSEPGDPVFVTGPGNQVGRPVHVAARGVHCHFPLWSPDDAHVYFVRGTPPDAMDIWRMRPDGSRLEQLTFHNARVTHPTFLEEHTLLYLSTADDGSGPWLFALDVDRPLSRRIGFGVQPYTSLAASADGRRLLATVTHLKASLWRAPITEDVASEASATRIPLRTIGGHSPRLGPGVPALRVLDR